MKFVFRAPTGPLGDKFIFLYSGNLEKYYFKYSNS